MVTGSLRVLEFGLSDSRLQQEVLLLPMQFTVSHYKKMGTVELTPISLRRSKQASQ